MRCRGGRNALLPTNYRSCLDLPSLPVRVESEQVSKVGRSSDRAESAAFELVAQCWDVTVEPYDHSGRQGAVDALLHYADGRVAAMEVTSVAAGGRRQLYALLSGEYQTLPNPGEWT